MKLTGSVPNRHTCHVRLMSILLISLLLVAYRSCVAEPPPPDVTIGFNVDWTSDGTFWLTGQQPVTVWCDFPWKNGSKKHYFWTKRAGKWNTTFKCAPGQVVHFRAGYWASHCDLNTTVDAKGPQGKFINYAANMEAIAKINCSLKWLSH